jgi:serine/threonine-protein kinase
MPRLRRAPRTPASEEREPYDSADPALAAALLAPRYEVLRRLGRGALAATYHVRETATGREAVARVIHDALARDATASAHIRRLARADLTVTHPHTVRTLEVSVEGARAPYVICEFVDGRDLGSVMREEGRMALPRALGIARDVADALAAAHGRGIVSGNLRPSGVLVENATGRAKVYEFDSPLFGEAGLLSDATYAAPEQLEDPGEGPRPPADLFALGGMLYAMLAGTPPFGVGHGFEIMRRKTEGTFPPVATHRPETPRAVENLLDYLLAADPARRGSAAQARDELAFILTSL